MINESRLRFIEELELFINDKQKVLNSVFDKLGWTEESMKDDVKVRCPVNPGHWIPESTLHHHKQICEAIKDGYTKEELDKQPPDSTFFYEKTTNVIPVVLDQSTLEKVLSENNCNAGITCKDFPKTVDRWSVQFTPEQRLAIYDFIVNASKTVEKPKSVNLEELILDFEKKDNQEEKPKSQLEILAEIRDYKRRRQSYRAKNVHITKKSYTEVMREVIENQTNYLMEVTKLEKSEEEKHENVLDNERKNTNDSDNNGSSGDVSPKNRDPHSSHKSDHHDSKSHRSSHISSKRYSHKRKKHKRYRSRSRSRSPSRHRHKKSRKKKSHYD